MVNDCCNWRGNSGGLSNRHTDACCTRTNVGVGVRRSCGSSGGIRDRQGSRRTTDSRVCGRVIEMSNNTTKGVRMRPNHGGGWLVGGRRFSGGRAR